MAMCEIESTRVCRLCQASEPVKHSVPLFSPAGLQQQWVSRIKDHLDVTMICNDGLPGYMCRKCKRRFVALEKAAEDLVDFREQATKCQESLVLCRGALKRTKETSGTLVSPDIAKARPSSKRTSTSIPGRRLEFGIERELTVYMLKGVCKIDSICSYSVELRIKL